MALQDPASWQEAKTRNAKPEIRTKFKIANPKARNGSQRTSGLDFGSASGGLVSDFVLRA
jgi:hypothetical protein